MRPIRRIASADFLMVLGATVFFGGCGESTTSPPVTQETAKISPEQELAVLTKKAEAGDAEAQFALGMMHRDGFTHKSEIKSTMLELNAITHTLTVHEKRRPHS